MHFIHNELIIISGNPIELSRKQLELLKRIHLNSDCLQSIIHQKIDEMNGIEELKVQDGILQSLHVDSSQQENLSHTNAIPAALDSTSPEVSSLLMKPTATSRSPCNSTSSCYFCRIDEHQSTQDETSQLRHEMDNDNSNHNFDEFKVKECSHQPSESSNSSHLQSHFKLEDWLVSKLGYAQFKKEQVEEEGELRKNAFVDTLLYHSAEFRILPIWFPLYDLSVAFICLVVSVVIMGLNIVLYAMEQ